MAIDINADMLTFQNQIISEFGNQYYEQTEIFFNRAVSQANDGLLYSALADGKFALELNHYSPDKTGVVYLIGFLSQLHCDIGEIRIARSYYELGMKLLDPLEESYEDDMQLYIRLKELIDGESWKGEI
ncbi:MAG: hypothetical protein EOO43_02870 [Flavobacterium sp.]|nr:MAG: hypothetical protein EOO43_02870 [Flavobacterium sp.]